jgi:phosphatidylserine/phosphatidylglycerophosphate/cardiolipin synthase-like enzyme
MEQRSRVAALKALLGRDTDLVSRLAAPLWARSGRKITVDDLAWTRALGGESAPQVVWGALAECAGSSNPEMRLDPECIAGLCSALLSPAAVASAEPNRPNNSPGLVWTLPSTHAANASRGLSYRDTIIELVCRSLERLILVAPFIDAAGIGSILTPLLSAMLRGVRVDLLTHDALNLSSFTSRAIEELRREAERIRGRLTVYSADAGSGRDRQTHPLLHSKLVVRDASEVIVGSANLTSHALASNFEAGVLLGRDAATEATHITDEILRSKIVYLVFDTGPPL